MSKLAIVAHINSAIRDKTAAYSISNVEVAEILTDILDYTDEKVDVSSNDTIRINGDVVYESELIFKSTILDYRIIGAPHTSPAGTITLDAADSTFDRFDVIYADTNNSVGILKGTASVNPVIPVVDPASQIQLLIVQINAGATVPANISDVDVYKENTEWAFESDVVNADPDYTSNSHAGTKSVYFPTGFPSGKYADFIDTVVRDVTNYTYLKLYIRINTVWTNTMGFYVCFRLNGVKVSTYLLVKHGSYSFNGNLTGVYQQVIIPLYDFVAGSTSFDTIHLIPYGTQNGSFHLDNIRIQYGGGSSVDGGVETFAGESGNVTPKFSHYRGLYIDDAEIVGTNLLLKKGDTVITIPLGTPPIEVLVGSAAATALNILADSFTIDNASFSNRYVEVLRNNINLPSIDPEDGTAYFTKPLISNSIALSIKLYAGELIKIKVL